MHSDPHTAVVQLLMREREEQADRHNRAVRLVAARRWEKRAAEASSRARAARAAVW